MAKKARLISRPRKAEAEQKKFQDFVPDFGDLQSKEQSAAEPFGSSSFKTRDFFLRSENGQNKDQQ
jgi:hypothetical protein